MAKCEYCGEEMLTADSCKYNYIRAYGHNYKRQKVGDEGWCSPGEHCPDCGALYGNYHHLGCDVERCPVCGDQLIGCSCDLEYLVNIEEK